MKAMREFFWLLFALALCLSAGCGKKTGGEHACQVYYLK